MTPERKTLHATRIAVAILFWPALALVVWGSLAAFSDPILDLGVSFEDLILHVTAYSGLAAMAAVAFRGRTAFVLALIGLVLLGGALEYLQSFAGREMSAADGLANILGVVIGGVAVRAIVECLRRRYDSSTNR